MSENQYLESCDNESEAQMSSESMLRYNQILTDLEVRVVQTPSVSRFKISSLNDVWEENGWIHSHVEQINLVDMGMMNNLLNSVIGNGNWKWTWETNAGGYGVHSIQIKCPRKTPMIQPTMVIQQPKSAWRSLFVWTMVCLVLVYLVIMAPNAYNDSLDASMPAWLRSVVGSYIASPNHDGAVNQFDEL